MKRCSLSIFILTIVFLNHVQANTDWMLINPDTRYSGMAGAATAIVNDVSALYYNPAGLANCPGFSASANYTNRNSYDIYFAGSVKNLGRYGSIGTSLYDFDFGEVKNSDQYGNVIYGKHFYRYICIGYGYNITRQISVGLSGKYIFLEDFFTNPGFKGDGYSADLGLQVNNIFPALTLTRNTGINPFPRSNNYKSQRGLSFGIALCNLGPAIEYTKDTTTYETKLTPCLRVGAAWHFLDTDLMTAVIAYDFLKDYYEYDPLISNLIGGEISLFSRILFRYGRFIYSDVRNSDYSTWGLSIGPERFRINYCRYPSQKINSFGLTCAF